MRDIRGTANGPVPDSRPIPKEPSDLELEEICSLLSQKEAVESRFLLAFASLNDPIPHPLVTKTVNSEPIPITSNFIRQ